MGQLLGCSMEGVAAESVKEILTGKVTQLKQDHQWTLQQVKYSEWLFSLECRAIRDGSMDHWWLHICFPQLSSCRSELEGTKGELAAANVKVTILESQLEQGRETAVGKETQIRQLRVSIQTHHGTQLHVCFTVVSSHFRVNWRECSSQVLVAAPPCSPSGSSWLRQRRESRPPALA